jgi:hypothetical protein
LPAAGGQKTGLSAPIFFAAFRGKKGFPLQSLARISEAR